MLKYAVIGLGGLGKKHLVNLDEIEKKRKDMKLCGLCGASREDFKKKVGLNIGAVDISCVDIESCTFYEDYKELIEKEKPDFIVSALPTYLHEEVAVYALSKGVNVFSEKPMAQTIGACENMLKAAKENDRKLMIGQCLRFRPAFLKIKEIIDSKVYGNVYRAEFTRYSATPKWTWNNWILNPELSGGCAVDMHIHDVDMINLLFGKPKEIYSVATSNKAERESIFTNYIYDGGLLVQANADWSMADNFPFTEKCIINFDNATLVTDGSDITIYVEGKKPIIMKDTGEDMFKKEMEAFVEMVATGKDFENVAPESVIESMKIVMAEIKSAETKKPVIL